MGLRGRLNYLDEVCFFVTTTCYRSYHLLKQDACKRIVEESMNFLNKKYDSAVLGYVIMPNHIHLIIYFKKLNVLSAWMRDLKKFTSVMIRKEIERMNPGDLEKLRIDGKRDQVFKVWEDRFDDVYLAGKKLLETKLAYIHSNPLQEHWSLVVLPEHYPFSSAGFYELGVQPGVTITDYLDYF